MGTFGGDFGQATRSPTCTVASGASSQVLVTTMRLSERTVGGASVSKRGLAVPTEDQARSLRAVPSPGWVLICAREIVGWPFLVRDSIPLNHSTTASLFGDSSGTFLIT